MRVNGNQFSGDLLVSVSFSAMMIILKHLVGRYIYRYTGISTKNKVCLVKIDLHHSERKDTVTVYLPKALDGAFSSRKGSIKASAKWKICIQGSK